MTDQPLETPSTETARPVEHRARTARVRRPGPMPVISGTIALFAVSFGFLTYQLRSGNDPALGAQALASTTAPRPVIVRRVIKRRIITQVVPAGATTVPVTNSAPVTTSSAPVVSAPAPAPVTTSAS